VSLHSGQNLTAGHLSDLLGGKTKASPKKRKQKETQPEETQPEETEGETIEMDVQATAVSHVQVCEVAMADVHGTSFFDGALPVSGAFDVEDLVGKYIYIPKNFFAKR